MSSSKAFGNPPISDQLRKPKNKRQVVRIEAGMVIVDTKDVDQEVGKDLDPEHEKAEVEDWCGRCRFEGCVQNYGMVKISTMKNDDHGEDYAVDVVADGLYE